MTEKQTNKDRLKEITDSIETGIKELFQSEKYMKYLRTMSRFHRYSVNNTMLIYMQNPDATLVAGFNKWKKEFSRNVKKGEKGIKIIAPTPFLKKIEQEKLDPDTQLPMRDEDGNIITEEKEVKIPMYKPVTVFDVSQTEGKPLPTLAADLRGDVKHYEIFMEALRRSSPVPVEFEKMAENMDGYFSRDHQRIAVREGMSEVQTVSAAVHEIAHAKLHNYKEKDAIDDEKKYQEIELFGKPALFSNGRVDREKLPENLFCYDLRGSDYDPGYPITIQEVVVVNHAASVITAEPIDLTEKGFLYLEDNLNFIGGNVTLQHFYEETHPDQVKKDRNTEEVEAESVSFAVCAYYGIETGENSFGYIASWSDGKELKELRSSLETINKTASELISDIDRNFAEICKERGVDLSNEQSGTPVIYSNSVSDGETLEIAATDTTLDEYPIPDKDYDASDIAQHGIHDQDFIPISKDTAAEMIDRDLTVYAVTYEGAIMAFDRAEVEAYRDGTVFAILREEWEQTAEFKDAVTNRMNHQQERETAFLNHSGDCFAIYQVKLGDDTLRDLRYVSLEQLQKQGLQPSRGNYELAYTGELPEGHDLNSLWERFNINHPADYMRPSLSVSDIVALRQDGVVSCHYVDSVGFKELPDFLQPENHLKNAEMQMEDDYNMLDGIINNGPKQPTVTELEEQVKSGQAISRLDLAEAVQREKEPKNQTNRLEKKPSILAKLRRPLPTERTNKTAPEKSAEREYDL